VVGSEGVVEVWDAKSSVPAGATIVGDYHTHPAIVPGYSPGEWFRENGEIFSGSMPQYRDTDYPVSMLQGGDFHGARMDLNVRENLDASFYTSYLSTPSGRFLTHHVQSGQIYYYGPSIHLLP
jgi:hypothetical protein